MIAFCVMPDHLHLLLEGLTYGADFRMAVHNWNFEQALPGKSDAGDVFGRRGFTTTYCEMKKPS